MTAQSDDHEKLRCERSGEVEASSHTPNCRGAKNFTAPLPDAYPVAEAVMFAAGDPAASPVTCGAVAGVVAPAAMVTEEGLTVALAESLASVTVTAAAAGADRVTCRFAD